jgi:ABC-type transporter Mla subunit MlaD
MPRQHDEVWAGGFVALALALLFVMVFSIGNCRQVLRGRQEMTVLFSHVTGLQSNSPVNYAGVEIGRVREIRILTVTPELLAALPAIGADEVDRLPVSLEEADRLKAIAKPQELNEKARELIVKRTIIGLQLEIARGSREIVFREDDLVRLEATLMGQSTVEISPGSGKELPAGRNLLGDGSNLLTQMSSSMRDVRKLLERLSNIVGDEERTAIHATLANIKKVSDDASQTITAVRDMVKENREGLRTSVADLRKAMEEARKAVEEIRPAAVAMVDSGRKMMDKGQETTKLSAEILNDAKPHLLSLIENADKAAKATAGTIEELDHLLVEAGDTVEESDMTDRLKFEPWLLMKAPAKGSQDVALLDQSARNLASASDNLTVAVEQLKNIAEGNAPDVDAKRIADLMEQMRAVIKKLEERRTELEKKLKPLQRKDGGRVMETVREKADQDK